MAWYKIFGRLAAGPNAKVRLNDYYLPGKLSLLCRGVFTTEVNSSTRIYATTKILISFIVSKPNSVL